MPLLIYRAVLDDPIAHLVSASVHSGVRDGQWSAHRVTLHYATAWGHVRTHRGHLYADLPPGRQLHVAGYQIQPNEVLLSLQPSPILGEHSGMAIQDQFRLPIALQVPEMTTLQGADLSLSLRACKASRQGLALRGTLHLRLNGQALPLRIPFLRMLSLPHVPPGLQWRAHGALTAVSLSIDLGGSVTGEVGLFLRCEGRPHSSVPQAELRMVRDLSGQVSRVTADLIAPEQALVQGVAALDLYWIDQDGASRWTGRELPFSSMLHLPGVESDARLEATATVERMTHRVSDGAVAVALLGTVRVTALRMVPFEASGQRYRLEQIVGEACTSITATDCILSGPVPPSEGERIIEDTMLQTGLGHGWQDVSIQLGAAAVHNEAGVGRLLVGLAVRGTPTTAPGAPWIGKDEVRHSIAARGPIQAIAGLRGFSSNGVKLKTTIWWGHELPAGSVPEVITTVDGDLSLPVGIRKILGATVVGRVVHVLAVTAAQELRLIQGALERKLTGPVHITIWPCWQSDGYHLRLRFEQASTHQ